MRRQFNSAYQQTISLIKELKKNNDGLNRVIGVDPSQSIARRIQQETPKVQNTISTVQQYIQKLQQSYLDPDTARKIGNAKQQFRIQKDRRKQLVHSIDNHHDTLDRYNSKVSQITELEGTYYSETKNSFDTENLTTWENKTRQTSQEEPKKGESREIVGDEDHYEIDGKMMAERGEEINHMSRNLLNIHSIINETSNLTNQQGEQLDIIGDDMFSAYKGVREARQQLNEANTHQKKAKRKYIAMSVIAILFAVVAVAIILT